MLKLAIFGILTCIGVGAAAWTGKPDRAPMIPGHRVDLPSVW